MAWINVDFIESVAFDTPENIEADNSDFKTISNKLLEATEKLNSVVVFPACILVRVPLLKD
jgi:hypothetical protein